MKTLPNLVRALQLTAVVALILAATSPLLAVDRMQPGKWEFTLSGDGPSRTFSQCMTADQANEMNGDAKTARAFAEKRMKGPCRITSYDLQGNTVTYSLACGDRTIDSTTTFVGDTSEGTLKTTTADGKVSSRTVKARRLGACS